ncbi:MAG: AAA family ATPase [Bryobacteraceae bacterium]
MTEALPAWANHLSGLYFSGTTSMFVLHGAVHDFVNGGEENSYVPLVDFLAERIFGRWDLVLHYDLARGLRVFAGRDGARLKEMVVLANRRVGDLAAARKDPPSALALLDRFVMNNIMAAEGDRLSAAIILDGASFVAPAGDPGRLNMAAATNLVTLLNWASSLHVKRLNMAFVLIDEKSSAVSERITGSPHVATIEVGLPEVSERERFLGFAINGRDFAKASDYAPPELARLTAGITLVDLNVMVQTAFEGSQRANGGDTSGRLDSQRMRVLKKQLIERQCLGLLEFVEPKWNLDAMVGHEPVKQRLRDDASLLKRGASAMLPMGYLICGPVGTGKTFLAQCTAGEIGIPSVVLKNFRSKYVGETEGNLERVLTVLRAMGPVVVIIDEADAALGDRDQSGDSGTSSRVFSMIAAQMGDTRYRGQILWMLLTCRPDLLPIDIKRQGRAEVHIPLFYPSTDEELRAMFVAMARKLGAKLDPSHVPAMPYRGKLSGADIEGMVGRALRQSLLAGSEGITAESLAAVAADFLPSTESAEKELQELAAILECTDRQFLPDDVVARVDALGGRAKVEERYAALRRLIELL